MENTLLKEKEINYPIYDDEDDLRDACTEEIEVEYDCDGIYCTKPYPSIANDGHIIKVEVANPNDFIEIQFHDIFECGNNAEDTVKYLARLIKVEYIQEKVIAHYQIKGA